MRLSSHTPLLAAAVALGAPGAARADLIGISEGLGQTGYIALRDVSSDGRVAIGDEYFDGGGAPFRWTRMQGVQYIGVAGDQAATAVTPDGSVAVGGGSTDAWYAPGTQAILLPSLTGVASEGGAAQDVSADGSVIVGWSYPGTSAARAVYWTTSGIVPLGFLGSDTVSFANAISADASVIAGSSGGGGAGTQAVVWVGGAAPVGLGDLAGGAFSSAASAVSADGTTVVGTGTTATHLQAFRWTSATGLHELGDLPGGTEISRAHDVSGDGSLVVGAANLHGGTIYDGDAFIWDDAHGMRLLEDFLRDEWGLGFEPGWVFTQANGISDDGRAIVGAGLDPYGNRVAFIATIPEPGTALLVGAALAALAARRRRR